MSKDKVANKKVTNKKELDYVRRNEQLSPTERSKAREFLKEILSKSIANK